MTLQSICTSQELSRKLAEAGFTDSYFCWIKQENGEMQIGGRVELNAKIEVYGNVWWLPAFTLKELLAKLPKRILSVENKKHCNFVLQMERYSISYWDKDKREILIWINREKAIDQEAAGELLLWCKDNGYLND